MFASFAVMAVCVWQGVRWNRRHGRPQYPPIIHSAEYTGLEEVAHNRSGEARRLIRHRESTRDPRLARLVVLQARQEYQQWENPWGAAQQSAFGVFQFFLLTGLSWSTPSSALPFIGYPIALIALGFAAFAPALRTRHLTRSSAAITAHEPITAEESTQEQEE